MQTTIFALLFIATAPIGLLPAILAIFHKIQGAGWVTLANAVVWIGFPFAQTIGIPVASVATMLVAWLFLLRFAIVKSSLPTDRAEPTARKNALDRSRDS
jgi:hypothetical protein